MFKKKILLIYLDSGPSPPNVNVIEMVSTVWVNFLPRPSLRSLPRSIGKGYWKLNGNVKNNNNNNNNKRKKETNKQTNKQKRNKNKKKQCSLKRALTLEFPEFMCGIRSPWPKKMDDESKKAFKSRLLEERYRLYMEKFKEYLRINISKTTFLLLK